MALATLVKNTRIYKESKDRVVSQVSVQAVNECLPAIDRYAVEDCVWCVV